MYDKERYFISVAKAVDLEKEGETKEKWPDKYVHEILSTLEMNGYNSSEYLEMDECKKDGIVRAYYIIPDEYELAVEIPFRKVKMCIDEDVTITDYMEEQASDRDISCLKEGDVLSIDRVVHNIKGSTIDYYLRGFDVRGDIPVLKVKLNTEELGEEESDLII